MKSKWTIALVIAALGTGMYAGDVLATPSAGVATTILAKSLFDEFDVKARTLPADVWQARLKTHGQSDVYVVDNKFAPGGRTGWHSHPGPSLILVTSGTVTNYEASDPTCTGHAYTAGMGFIDAGGDDVHMLRNESSTTPAETIAVQFLPTGAVRRIDKPQPSNCNF
jgi:quercetin dioxygenase-like cupin family protein